jgi:hypothetical protein
MALALGLCRFQRFQSFQQKILVSYLRFLAIHCLTTLMIGMLHCAMLCV